jgi:hypothetical protein
LTLPSSLPILADHEAKLDSVAGVGTPRVEVGRLLIEGSLASTEAAARIVGLAKDGVPLQSSVGVSPGERTRVKPGENIDINGRQIKAAERGLTLIQTGELREISVVPLGADSSTSVHVAARAEVMENEELEVGEVQQERSRIKTIRALCRGEHPRIEAAAIDEGWSIGTTKEALLDAIRASRAGTLLPYSGGHSFDPQDSLVAACMLWAGGGQQVVKHVRNGEQLANSIRRPRGFAELCVRALEVESKPVPSGGYDLLKAGFSTVSMPVALGTAFEKLALDPFLEISSNWMSISKIVPLSNFRPGKVLRLAAMTALQIVGNDGELKHSYLSEDAFTVQMSTYGRMATLTRQDIINDDAGILAQLPEAYGAEAARTVADLFFAVLIGAETAAYFSSTNANLLTGALGITETAAAVAALASQTDIDQRVLNLQPKTMIVPAALRFIGSQVLKSEQLSRIATGDQLAQGNPLADYGIELKSEARLDKDSAKNWYLFSSVMWAPMVVATLGGKLGVTVEQAPTEANVLGQSWRAYLDFGVGLGEPRAAVKSKAP